MIQTNQMHTSNTVISYLSTGDEAKASHGDVSKPIIVLLHGFPENSWSWERYLTALSEEYYVVAPDLPGYNASQGYAASEQYTIMQLIETFAEFIQNLLKGRKQSLIGKPKVVNKVHLVAHDWGGVIAWPLAAFKSDLIEKLTIINAAHPTGFTREMANNPRQQANSDYISDLISDNAYAITSKDEHKMLKRLYGGFFKKLSDNQQSRYVQQWSDKHAMQQAFAYYKNMPQLVTTRLSANTEVKLPNIHIHVPTQVLWGMRDTAFVPEVLDGMEQWVDDLSLHQYDDADHWLHHQKADEVIDSLREFHR